MSEATAFKKSVDNISIDKPYGFGCWWNIRVDYDFSTGGEVHIKSADELRDLKYLLDRAVETLEQSQ